MSSASGFFPTAVSGALRAAGQIEQWDESKVSPVGYRHWESGEYKPAAKGFAHTVPDGLAGGFQAQKESGRAAEFGNTFIQDSGFLTPTLTLTFNLGEINTHPDSFFNLMVADGSVSAAFKAFNMRFWIHTDTVFRDKGYQPEWFFLQQSGWTRNIQLSSGTAGALPLPSSLPESQNVFVNGTDIFSSGSYVEAEVSNFIHVAAHFPTNFSGYELGTYGGIGGSGFQFKFSYEWTNIDARVRVTDTIPCLDVMPSGTPDIDPIAQGLQDDVMAYWNMDESSGTRVDSVGSLDLAENGTVSNGTGPDGGTAAEFDGGAANFLEVGDDPIISMGVRDFVWCGWVRWNGTKKAVAERIFGKYNQDTDAREILFDWVGPSATAPNEIIRFLTSRDGTAATFDQFRITSLGEPSSDAWHFFMVEHNETTNEFIIEMDNNGTQYTFSKGGDGVFDGGTVLRFGAALIVNADTDGAQNLDGRLAKWGVFHRLLTEAEKDFLYSSGNGVDYPFV